MLAKKLNGYQWDFLTSEARFPGMVSAWGTGKTLVLIQRAVKLSQCYKQNLGLIVRKVFQELRDSTIKDFETYTGLKVPMGSRDVVMPGGSRIMFRHLEELTGGPTRQLIQNVNLGFFAIEQAEEFEGGEQFEMLRGRLRRRLTPDEDYFAAYEARQFVLMESGKCLSCGSVRIVEGDGNPTCEDCGFFWSRAENPRMTAFHKYLRSHELRSGWVIANANGKNWVWRNWISPNRRNKEEFPGVEATTFDNAHNLPSDFVRDLESMKDGTETQQRKYRRYVLNCHDEADIEGSYYLKLIQEARKQGRIGSGVGFDPDKSVSTHTAWDLGVSDSTSIWWFQKVGKEIRIIHYYENCGEGLEHYIRYVDSVGSRLKLRYGSHYWPHDGKKRDLSTGKELLSTAREMGLKVTPLRREKRVVDGIERTRKLFPYCTFDESECVGGLDALEHYQRRKNSSASTEEKSVYSDTPLHDWSSNGADAFRYVSAAVRKTGGSMTAEEVKELQAAYS